MPDISFREQCALGEKADGLYLEGRLAEAEQAYMDLLHRIEHTRIFDAFVAAKIALGLLLTYIAMDELLKAHRVWVSDSKDYPIGVGIFGLENGQTSHNDLILYYFVCAFLHSLSTEDKTEAVLAVNEYMSRILGYARAEKRELLPMAMGNWKQHLREIFGTTVPDPHAHPFLAAEASHGMQVGWQRVAFPRPAPWVVDWSHPEDEAVIFYPDGKLEAIPVDEVDARSCDAEGSSQ